MNIALIRWGFILILIGLVASLAAPTVKVPALAVSAHTISLIGGVLLAVIGAVWDKFQLSDGQKKLLAGSWLYANFGNWLGVSIASLTGATAMLSINGGESSAGQAAEIVVGFLMLSISVAAILGAVLAIYGLRGKGD